jgi:hypothetical protein
MKPSKISVIGISSQMCFHCYCHHECASRNNIKALPYQKLAKRRKAIRCQNRTCLHRYVSQLITKEEEEEFFITEEQYFSG